jgi:choice-of-anchor B domain-containing protein
MKSLLATYFVLITCWTFSQLNVDSLSHISYQQLHGANLNDVWGYEDEMGNEYAIVGTSKGTSIVDISNPSNPVEIFWMPGTESIWRDPCVYGDYAYVTTEADDGLLIIDLSPFLNLLTFQPVCIWGLQVKHGLQPIPVFVITKDLPTFSEVIGERAV